MALDNITHIRKFVLSIIKVLRNYYGIGYDKIRRKIGRNFEKEIPVVFSAMQLLYDEKVF